MIASRVASYFFHVYYKALTNAFREDQQQQSDINNGVVPLQKLTEFYGSESTAAFAREDARQTNAVGAAAIVSALKDNLEHCNAGSIADFKVEVEKAYFVRSRSGSVVASTEGFFLFPTAEVAFNQTFHLVPTSHRPDTYYISAECLHLHPVKKCADQKEEAAVSATTTAAAAAPAATTPQQQPVAAAAATTTKPAPQKQQEQPAATAASTQQQTATAAAVEQQKPKPKRSLKEALSAAIPEPATQAPVVTSEATNKRPANNNNNTNNNRERRAPRVDQNQDAAAPSGAQQQQQQPRPAPRGKRAAAAGNTTENAERQPAAQNNRNNNYNNNRRPAEQQNQEQQQGTSGEQKPRPKRDNNNQRPPRGENGVANGEQQQPRPAPVPAYAQLDGLNDSINYATIRRTLESMGNINVGKIVFTNGHKSAVLELRSGGDCHRLVIRGAFILGEGLSVTAKKTTKEEFDKLPQK